MKEKLKKAGGVVLFFVLLFLAVMKCSALLNDKTSNRIYEDYFDADTNYDVLFFGTSHMYNFILPQEMWYEYGISSYNWGYANCTPAENYYLMQETMKYTDAKVIVMDLYGLIEYENQKDGGNGKYRTDKVEQQHVQFDMLPLTWSKYKATQDIFDDYDGNLDFVWNFIKYHNRWKELGETDFSYTRIPERGAGYLSGWSKGSYTSIGEEETMDLTTVCYDYLIKTLEYCQENGIELLCTYLPWNAKAEQQRVANSLPPVIEKYEHCHYVNMLNMNLVNFDTDINEDRSHLNYSGATKVTHWLGAYLKEHYDLADHSQEAEWIDGYADYRAFKMDKMSRKETIKQKLLLLRDLASDAVIIIHDPDLLKSEDIQKFMENLGIERQELQADHDIFLLRKGGEKTSCVKTTETSASTVLGDLAVTRDGETCTITLKDTTLAQVKPSESDHLTIIVLKEGTTEEVGRTAQ